MTEELRTLLSRSRELERELDGVRRQIAHLPRGIDASALTVLWCHAGDAAFCIPVEEVAEVVPNATLLSLAEPSAWLRGTLNLGGELVPIVDVGARIGATPYETGPDDSLTICQVADHKLGIVTSDVPRVVASAGPVMAIPSQLAQTPFVVGALRIQERVAPILSTLLLANVAASSAEEH